MKKSNHKKSIFAVAVATGLSLAGTAQATLLVYENFNYSTGTASGNGGVLFNGQGASNTFGMTGTWTTGGNGTVGPTVYQQGNLSGVNLNTGVGNTFNGTVAAPSNFATSGGYMGPVSSLPGGTSATTDQIAAYRPLAPSVTATFQAGTTTWFSFVSARAFNANPSGPKFAIGAAQLNTTNRGFQAFGEAIGGGGGIGGAAGAFNNSSVYPQFWDETVTGSGTFSNYDAGGVQTSTASTSAVHYVSDSFTWASDPTTAQPIANIVIGKIVWSNTGPDVLSLARFLPTSGTLTESLFNSTAYSSSAWATQPNLDQSQFDTISFAGGRYFIDELRLATTFTEVIGGTLTAIPEPASSFALLSLLSLGAFARNRRK
jgi:hypothetical protein